MRDLSTRNVTVEFSEEEANELFTYLSLEMRKGDNIPQVIRDLVELLGL